MHSDLLIHLANSNRPATRVPVTEPDPQSEPEGPTLVLRRAGPADAPALRRLAALDSTTPLDGDVLVALADDEPVAALVLASGRVAADPFRHSAHAVELLRLRASSLVAAHEPSRLGRVRALIPTLG
jgi:hypothetical protein